MEINTIQEKNEFEMSPLSFHDDLFTSLISSERPKGKSKFEQIYNCNRNKEKKNYCIGCINSRGKFLNICKYHELKIGLYCKYNFTEFINKYSDREILHRRFNTLRVIKIVRINLNSGEEKFIVQGITNLNCFNLDVNKLNYHSVFNFEPSWYYIGNGKFKVIFIFDYSMIERKKSNDKTVYYDWILNKVLPINKK